MNIQLLDDCRKPTTRKHCTHKFIKAKIEIKNFIMHGINICKMGTNNKKRTEIN